MRSKRYCLDPVESLRITVSPSGWPRTSFFKDFFIRDSSTLLMPFPLIRLFLSSIANMIISDEWVIFSVEVISNFIQYP